MRELKETIEMMISDDYKERFKAEYWQTKTRYEKLMTLLNKIDASRCTKERSSDFDNVKPIPMPKHDCPYGILRDQADTMRRYLNLLELRAVIEEIDLTE